MAEYDVVVTRDEFNHWLSSHEALLETLDDAEIDLSCKSEPRSEFEHYCFYLFGETDQNFPFIHYQRKFRRYFRVTNSREEMPIRSQRTDVD